MPRKRIRPRHALPVDRLSYQTHTQGIRRGFARLQADPRRNTHASKHCRHRRNQHLQKKLTLKTQVFRHAGGDDEAMWYCGAIVAVTAWAIKMQRDQAPPRTVEHIRNARDAVWYLRVASSEGGCSTEDLMDRVYDDCREQGVSDEALTRLGRLLKRLEDPHGVQAYALTLVYTSALRARDALPPADAPVD